ncbi:hypothetical protein VFPFJ_11558 [Purpureocillium lilacinum]|uniref:Uncharacterized protein n=1 Tax=Purpureocillium lilacinum TaxID=33203 RepID=A0A179F2X0_PURLI|nr:hypothetical protein VFPFJ_11558 [Purpureocillium lilacinum]OAQ59782.1 hypothetical protein VFPFJ_11558 [Purpureocillium lilacinum]
MSPVDTCSWQHPLLSPASSTTASSHDTNVVSLHERFAQLNPASQPIWHPVLEIVMPLSGSMRPATEPESLLRRASLGVAQSQNLTNYCTVAVLPLSRLASPHPLEALGPVWRAGLPGSGSRHRSVALPCTKVKDRELLTILYCTNRASRNGSQCG